MSPSRKHYLRWYFSSFIIVLIIVVTLIYRAATIYWNAIDLINNSNTKMVEKAGIEMGVELNKQNLALAEKIIEKKNNPPQLPSRVRNIFLFDSYILTDGTIPATNTLPVDLE